MQHNVVPIEHLTMEILWVSPFPPLLHRPRHGLHMQHVHEEAAIVAFSVPAVPVDEAQTDQPLVLESACGSSDAGRFG